MGTASISFPIPNKFQPHPPAPSLPAIRDKRYKEIETNIKSLERWNFYLPFLAALSAALAALKSALAALNSSLLASMATIRPRNKNESRIVRLMA